MWQPTCPNCKRVMEVGETCYCTKQASSGKSELLVFNFSTKKPGEQEFFAYVHPDDPDRWSIGWRDGQYLREEGGGVRMDIDDPSLTIWHPLPGKLGMPIFNDN